MIWSNLLVRITYMIICHLIIIVWNWKWSTLILNDYLRDNINLNICQYLWIKSLNSRFYKRFRCCKTIQAYFEPRTNLSEHDTERTRFSLSSSRVILEPEGDRRNSDDPYNQAIQVVVTFNSINAKPQPIEQFVKETHQKLMSNEFRSEFKVNTLILNICQSNSIK